MGCLDELPAELYAAIFDCFEGTFDERKRTILALTRAIPRSPVPDTLLFDQIRLTHPQQAWLLYRRLRKRHEDASRVRLFWYECWGADADMVVNLLALLWSVEGLTLWFGPDFSPEHLEDLFKKPRDNLTFLFLRFRP